MLNNGWVPRCDWKIVTHHPPRKTFPTMCHHRSKAHRSRSRGTCSTTIVIATFCYLSQFPNHVHSEGKSILSKKHGLPAMKITPLFSFAAQFFDFFSKGKSYFTGSSEENKIKQPLPPLNQQVVVTNPFYSFHFFDKKNH